MNRRLRITMALLFTWMLPLQGAGAMPGCAHFDAAHSAAQGSIEHAHCKHGSAAAHPHGCGGTCCAAAIPTTRVPWTAPRGAAPDIAVALIWPSPTVELDRLDRPPRSG
jgi:hypothetical protein